MQDRPPIQVRKADTTDAMLLAEIGAQTFRDAFGPANTAEDMAQYLAKSFGEAIQASELQDPSNSFLVAEVSGEPVGYARLRSGPAPVSVPGAHPLEIVRFYSVKEWIGRGVGQRLMQECLDVSARMSHDTIWLDVWEKNERAIAFYKKWEFKVVGNQPFQLGDDLQSDLLMARPTGLSDRRDTACPPSSWGASTDRSDPRGDTWESISRSIRLLIRNDRLAKAGTVLLAGRTSENNEPTLGIVVLRADTEKAAEEVVKNDPAVLGGVMQAKLHPFSISIRAGRP